MQDSCLADHEQHPCPVDCAGWFTRTAPSVPCPWLPAESGWESISRVLISLQKRGSYQFVGPHDSLKHNLNCLSWAISIPTYLASVKNASSTPSFRRADVSMNLIPSSLASSRPCSSVTARFSVQSDLFPMRILLTPSDACCSMLACQVRMSIFFEDPEYMRNGGVEKSHDGL